MIQERVSLLISSALLAICVNYLAWKWGFFQMPTPKHKIAAPINYMHVGVAFFLFFFIQLIIVPASAFLWIAFKTGSIPHPEIFHLDLTLQGILNLFAILMCFIVILALLLFLPRIIQSSVLGHKFNSSLKNSITIFAKSGLAWLLSFPIVLMLSQVISLILPLFYQGPHVEQVAVKQLRMVAANPWIFGLTIASVIALVPFIEEVLFRGFLQTWLRTIFSRWTAISLTSVVFAFFHFSFSQKVDNIELLSSLFVLSFYLGILFEKEQSIIAPMGLHATFNAISILMILQT